MILSVLSAADLLKTGVFGNRGITKQYTYGDDFHFLLKYCTNSFQNPSQCKTKNTKSIQNMSDKKNNENKCILGYEVKILQC